MWLGILRAEFSLLPVYSYRRVPANCPLQTCPSMHRIDFEISAPQRSPGYEFERESMQKVLRLVRRGSRRTDRRCGTGGVEKVDS